MNPTARRYAGHAGDAGDAGHAGHAGHDDHDSASCPLMTDFESHLDDDVTLMGSLNVLLIEDSLNVLTEGYLKCSVSWKKWLSTDRLASHHALCPSLIDACENEEIETKDPSVENDVSVRLDASQNVIALYHGYEVDAG